MSQMKVFDWGKSLSANYIGSQSANQSSFSRADWFLGREGGISPLRRYPMIHTFRIKSKYRGTK